MDDGTPPPAGVCDCARQGSLAEAGSRLPGAVPLATSVLILLASSASAFPIALEKGWTIQSSAKVQAAGEAISRPGFKAEGWHSITVPNTVVGALVESGHF